MAKFTIYSFNRQISDHAWKDDPEAKSVKNMLLISHKMNFNKHLCREILKLPRKQNLEEVQWNFAIFNLESEKQRAVLICFVSLLPDQLY